jgi:hypothetical protein
MGSPEVIHSVSTLGHFWPPAIPLATHAGGAMIGAMEPRIRYAQTPDGVRASMVRRSR